MRFLKPYIIILLCVVVYGVHMAKGNTDAIIEDIYYRLQEDGSASVDYETLYEDLARYAENPINLNDTDREQLKKLYFLSDLQIENLLYYIYRTGGMQTIYELRLVEGLASYDIRNLLPFVRVGKPAERKDPLRAKDMLHYGRHQLLGRMDYGRQTREGTQFRPEEETEDTDLPQGGKYLGSPLYASLRYDYHYRDRLYAGLRMEKDAGEQFWGTHNKGFDSYGAYIQLNGIGPFKTIVAGDFRAAFGQGLVLNRDFSFGKSSYVLDVSPRTNGLRKCSSMDEYNFFRGIGATARIGRFGLTAFYSFRILDADTAGGSFPSLYTTGLHRTVSEVTKKRTLHQHAFGANATYTYNTVQVGLTLAGAVFNIPCLPRPTLYNAGYFRGDYQLTAGIDYRWRIHKFYLFGETALTHRLGVATVNGVKYYPVSALGIVALHRYYSGRFDNLFANAFAETSSMNNEQGIYIGLEARPARFWRISAYADTYSFPRPKYGIDKPSAGFDYFLQADYAPRADLNMYLRLRWEEKAANRSGVSTVAGRVTQKDRASVRYRIDYRFGTLTGKNQLDMTLAKTGTDKPAYGFSFLQDLLYRPERFPLSGGIRFQVFHTDTYDNRLYTYENDVLYALSIPMLNGTGCRYYLNLRYDYGNYLSVWLKAAQTVYLDSPLPAMRRTSDISLLLRCKF